MVDLTGVLDAQKKIPSELDEQIAEASERCRVEQGIRDLAAKLSARGDWPYAACAPDELHNALESVRSATGMTGNGHRYRSVLRDLGMWRMLAAQAGTLKPGVVQRAKAWGESEVSDG